MAKLKKPDQKTLALKRTGTLNPRPDSVSDALFKENPFFDRKDLLQVRYEMLRRHSVEGVSIVDVATRFGVSRPTVYQAQAAFQQAGLSGLLPKHRGPKEGHKLSTRDHRACADLASCRPRPDDHRLHPSRSGEVRHYGSPPQSRAGAGEPKKNRASRRKIAHSGGSRRGLRRTTPTSGPTGWTKRKPGRPRALSCGVAWLHGYRSSPRPYRHVHPNRLFHLCPKLQSSTRLEPNSSTW